MSDLEQALIFFQNHKKGEVSKSLALYTPLEERGKYMNPGKEGSQIACLTVSYVYIYI